MKKLLLMITLVLGLNVLAHAQQRQHKTPEQKAEHLTKMFSKKLNLDASQSIKVKAIFLARANEVDSLRANKADGKANREAYKAIFQKTDAQLAAVLKPEQKDAYAKLKDEVKSKFGKRGHHFGKGDMAHNPEKRAERMTGMLQQKLNLNADQSAKVKAVFMARAAKMDSLRATKVDGQKFDRSAFKSVRQQTDKELTAIFTPDQQKSYAQLKEQMKERMKNRRHGKDAPAPNKADNQG